MGVNKALDIKLVKFIERTIASYLNKRIKADEHEVERERDWLKNFRTNNKFISDIDSKFKINLYSDSILCKCIYFGFEKAELTFVERLLRKNDCFIDIGSNIGLFSLKASSVVGDNGVVYAFEPTPQTFFRFNENIQLNNFTNIHAENIGLSDKLGIFNFYTSNNGYDAWNSLVKLDQLTDSEMISIKVCTLDKYLNNNKIENISLIKLDVEGWEYNVLKGATNTLSKADAPILIVEFNEVNAFKAGYYCGQLFDYVESFGYKWYSYDSLNNTIKKEEKRLHYPYENLIAIKNLDWCINRLKT